MDIGTISTRYAKALFSFAKDEKTEADVFHEMICLSKNCLENSDLKHLLTNPMVSAEEKIMLLTTAAGINISNTTKKFIEFVVSKRKESYMHFIAMSYQNLYQVSMKVVSAEIISAEEIDNETLKKIAKFIEEKYEGNHVELEMKIDKKLIGGFVLKVGNNNKLDASVLGELKNVKKELKLLNSY